MKKLYDYGISVAIEFDIDRESMNGGRDTVVEVAKERQWPCLASRRQPFDMTIRAATLGDEQCLAELNGFVHGIHTRSRPEHFKTSSLAEVAAWFRSLLETSAARIWIAEVDGTAVGYVLSEVHASPESSLCRARRWCEIDQIAVDSQHRRRGIASALVREAIRAAACEGIADVELCTWAFNEEAQATFRELGFAPKVIRWELRRPHDDVVQVVPPQ